MFSNPATSKYFIVNDEHKFENPAKLIRTVNDMKLWEKSEAYFEYLGFIIAINEEIKGKSNSQGSQNLSKNVQNIVKMLESISKMVDEIPPIQQPQRFGNQAFRAFYQRLKTESMELLQKAFTDNLFRSIPEIAVYLVDGFGNPTRIDYGTGHELSFLMFLCCLFKVGFFSDEDRVATGCCIFPKYLDLARKVQQAYRMEPAGSHGVWSLDDYQFAPFIWGSSQLIAHPKIEPPSFLDVKVIKEYGSDYMFLSCIQYINLVKTGPFAEHSNQLWSISGVSTWSKINGGLIKMYKAEVLGKFPVVQHIVFGSLFTLKTQDHPPSIVHKRMSNVAPPKVGLQKRPSLTEESHEETGSAASGASGQSFSPSSSENQAEEEKESKQEDEKESKDVDDENELKKKYDDDEED